MSTPPSFPAGAIAADDSVCNKLTARAARLDDARMLAAEHVLEGNGDIYDFVNVLREVQGDRPVKPGDLHLVSPPQEIMPDTR